MWWTLEWCSPKPMKVKGAGTSWSRKRQEGSLPGAFRGSEAPPTASFQNSGLLDDEGVQSSSCKPLILW